MHGVALVVAFPVVRIKFVTYHRILSYLGMRKDLLSRHICLVILLADWTRYTQDHGGFADSTNV